MRVTVLEKRKKSLFDALFLKSYLRMGKEQFDSLRSHIEHLAEVSTEWSQERLGKSFLTQKVQVSHTNDRIILPYGPVHKEGIHSVKRRGKSLEKDRDYFIEPYKDTQRVVMPFSWKSHVTQVTYDAGYGDDPEDVPLSIRNSVLRSVDILYRSGGDLSVLETNSDVLMSDYKDFSLY